jgi:hypothetical protein
MPTEPKVAQNHNRGAHADRGDGAEGSAEEGLKRPEVGPQTALAQGEHGRQVQPEHQEEQRDHDSPGPATRDPCLRTMTSHG